MNGLKVLPLGALVTAAIATGAMAVLLLIDLTAGAAEAGHLTPSGQISASVQPALVSVTLTTPTAGSLNYGVLHVLDTNKVRGFPLLRTAARTPTLPSSPSTTGPLPRTLR